MIFSGGSVCQTSHSCAGHSPTGSKAASASATIVRIASRTRASSHGSSMSGSKASGRYSTTRDYATAVAGSSRGRRRETICEMPSPAIVTP